jgi:hypothetical protein
MDEDPVEVNPFEKKVKIIKIKNKTFEKIIYHPNYYVEIIVLIILFYLFVIEIIGIIYGFVYKGSIDLG